MMRDKYLSGRFFLLFFWCLILEKPRNDQKEKGWYKTTINLSYLSALWFLYFCIIHIYKCRPRKVKVVSVKDIVYLMQHVDIAYACCSMWSCFLLVQDNVFFLSVVALMCSVIWRHTPHFDNLFLCRKCIAKYIGVAEQDLISHCKTKKKTVTQPAHHL